MSLIVEYGKLLLEVDGLRREVTELRKAPANVDAKMLERIEALEAKVQALTVSRERPKVPASISRDRLPGMPMRRPA